LIFTEFEPDSAAAVPDSVLDRLVFLKVQDGTRAHREFEDLLRRFKIELPRKGRLAVFLKEPAMPAVTLKEEHVDAMLPASVDAAFLSWWMRSRQGLAADRTDLSAAFHPYGRCPLAAHREEA
jgi:hypothetical protein